MSHVLKITSSSTTPLHHIPAHSALPPSYTLLFSLSPKSLAYSALLLLCSLLTILMTKVCPQTPLLSWILWENNSVSILWTQESVWSSSRWLSPGTYYVSYWDRSQEWQINTKAMTRNIPVTGKREITDSNHDQISSHKQCTQIWKLMKVPRNPTDKHPLKDLSTPYWICFFFPDLIFNINKNILFNIYALYFLLSLGWFSICQGGHRFSMVWNTFLAIIKVQ